MTKENTYSGKVAYKGDVASNYERDRINEPLWAIEQSWMGKWASTIPADARILDVPAGTGRFVEIFLARRAQLTAVDVSEDMLAELRRRWPPDGERLIVQKADAEELPFPAESFDYVVSWRLFHLLPPAPAERVLRELARVCRGELVIEVFGVQQGGRWTVAARAFLSRLQSWFAALLRNPSPSGKPWSHITNYVHSEHALTELFRRCKLSVVRSETLTSYANAPARIYFLRAGGTSS